MKRTSLLQAFEKVLPAVSKKDMLDQSTCFVFNRDRIYAHNEEINISCVMPYNDGELIEGAVSAQEFYSLIKNMKEDDISLKTNNGEIFVRGKRLKAGMKIRTDVEAPNHNFNEINWHVVKPKFFEDLKFVSCACANNIADIRFACVNVQMNGLIEATDTFRIFRVKSTPLKFGEDFLILGKTAAQLQSYNLQFAALEQQTYGEGSWIHFKNTPSADLIFSCRRIFDRFPDIDEEGAFDIEHGDKVVFPSLLINALQRIWVFAKRTQEVEEEINILIEPGQLIVSGENENGWVREKCKMKYDGDPIEFSISPSFLAMILEKSRIATIDKRRTKIRFEEEEGAWYHVIALRQ